MADKEHKAKIIIKKVKKGGHGGHHGGSWKVAYADFVTAMMAFFLVMWLVNSLPKEKREQVAKYFQSYSLMDFQGAPGPIPGADLSILNPESNPPSIVAPISQNPAAPAKEPSEAEKLAEEVQKTIDQVASDLKGQVKVRAEADKLIFEIAEAAKGKQLFALGKADLTPDAKRLLDAVAPQLNIPGGKLTIEGYTDAYTYPGERYTNWELSTERASAARRELERVGVNPNMVGMVAGYAATRPFVPDNPLDPSNRRIRLVVEVPPKPADAGGKGAAQAQGKGKVPDNMFAKPKDKPVIAPPPPPESPIPPEKREMLDREIEKLYDEQTKDKL